MSYRRHLEVCNRFDSTRFLPLLLTGHRVGFVRKDNAPLLEALPKTFSLSTDGISILVPDRGPVGLTHAFAKATNSLVASGVVFQRRWRPGPMRSVPSGTGSRWGSGCGDEVVFVYDLEMPADFVPRNVDGEVEDFRILSARECLRLVRETGEFMYDVTLVGSVRRPVPRGPRSLPP